MDLTNSIAYHITDDKCTGCAACMNMCPSMAITMPSNSAGFIGPKVDPGLCDNCGKCVVVCPPLHVDRTNTPNPVCYAVRASDEMRSQSSSGGLFTLMADLTLSQGGAVCGVVFDKEFNAISLVSSKAEDVANMQGSKLVQAFTEYIYKKLKIMLGNGEKVLYVGTPCQVAALKAFLGKDYDNLLTIDFICGGVPSQFCLRKELTEMARGRTIKAVKFSERRFDWEGWHIVISFTDGSEYVGNNKSDPYIQAISHGLSLRLACYDCPFSQSPRQGDLTMGDFRGLDALGIEDGNKSGTSMVMVNNAKGEQAIAQIGDRVPMFTKVNCDLAKLPNRLGVPISLSPLRDRFLSLCKQIPLSRAVRHTLDRYYDICIVGNYLNENFGSIMTYYALYNVVKDLGYSVLMVDRPRSAPCKPVPAERLLEKGSYPQYAMSAVRDDKWHMRNLNDHASTFLVGSDQLFNAGVYRAYDGFNSLEWVLNNKKKLAYAASCGHDDVWCTDTYRAEMSYFLKQFDAVSVREKSAVQVFKRVFGVDAVHVIDPVFLCAYEHWQRLANLSPLKIDNKEKYLFGYILDPDKTKQGIVDDVCQHKKLPYHVYTEFGKKNNFYLDVKHAKVNTQLAEIMNCSFFVTDSFHGVCFSIIFKKDFVVIANRYRGYTRFLTILEESGLMNRLVHSWDEYDKKKPELLLPIDYDSVYARLQPLKDMSLAWLKNNLQKYIRKPLNDFDLSMKMMLEMQQRLEKKFNAQLKTLEKKIEDILDSKNMDGLPQTTIAVYEAKEAPKENVEGKENRDPVGRSTAYTSLEELTPYLLGVIADAPNIVIMMAIREIPDTDCGEMLTNFVQKLGLTTDFNINGRKSCLAVIDGGTVVIDSISPDDDAISAELEVAGQKLQLFAASYKNGNRAEIKLNDVNYANNMRGLNLVVLDKSTNAVIDAVNFDIWMPDAPSTRVTRG